jgi:hypothetical protein
MGWQLLRTRRRMSGEKAPTSLGIDAIAADPWLEGSPFYAQHRMQRVRNALSIAY